MLNRMIVRNFKRFDEVEIELGDPVVFIGPNNSGKTSALQALALWDMGLKRWLERRKGKATHPEERPGVAINRRDLVALPVPNAKLLWRDLHVRDVARDESGKTKQTLNVRVDILVEGITEDVLWECGLEFDYANEESFYCSPLRKSQGSKLDRLSVPPQAEGVRIAFLPPMSGLSANETRLDPGAINVRIGEGRTAEVLRNLCYGVANDRPEQWSTLRDQIEALFGERLEEPQYVSERGEIVMSYREDGRMLDISCSGRGLQQTLLLLAYMYINPGSVLLLDEPDAHLEILRQRQIYQLLTDVARLNGNQIIAASHSEVLLDEAAGRDVVVAFLGKPHRINDRKSQVLKSLKEIGFHDYYQAAQTGWVLYLEGSTDLAILRAFADRLGHKDAQKALERPFVCYVANQPDKVRQHFHGIREAVPGLKGLVVFDRLDRPLPEDLGADGFIWRKREVENYLCSPETLIAYAEHTGREEAAGDLFSRRDSQKRVDAMQQSIGEIGEALERLGKGGPWDPDTKASDDFLVPLFKDYFKRLDLPNIMDKKQFHELARFVPESQIDAEVKGVLDRIVRLSLEASGTV
jgi:ABC-type taurine transport system ATPase subunit